MSAATRDIFGLLLGWVQSAAAATTPAVHYVSATVLGPRRAFDVEAPAVSISIDAPRREYGG